MTPPIHKPNCLVTGGAGFIGSYLVERLVLEGHRTIVLDNFHTGRPGNLDHIQDNPLLEIHRVDIAQPGAAAAYCSRVDWLFHLAALADIVPSIRQPLDYHRTNVDGTVMVLEAARHAQVKRFIYTASSSCYGIPELYPTPEETPAKPLYPYAHTKWVGECYALHWGALYGLPVVSLRLFNVFGPRHRTTGAYGAVFGVFLAQRLANKPLTMVGDGSQTRDFTFVDDVVEAFIAAARSPAAGRVYNVGSGGSHAVNYLASLIGGPVESIPKRPGEPDCTFADITRIGAELGWHPRMSFEEGVAIMMGQIEQWQGAPVWSAHTIAEATREWFQYVKTAP